MRAVKLSILCLILACQFSSHAASIRTPEDLGQLLFFDPILSFNKGQSCSTCHNPTTAFIDPRAAIAKGAISVGADGHSLGRRNTPGLTYLAEIPDFHVNAEGAAVGGFFLDGRAKTRVEQASGPIFSDLEMAMPSPQTLRDRLKSSAVYASAFLNLFGDTAFDDPNTTVQMVGMSLAAFQSSSQFSSFDSKYDRFLRDEAKLTSLEEHGRVLFFSSLINCASCHQLPGSTTTFSDHTFHNIGVPRNTDLTHLTVDLGLAENPAANKPTNRGKFRVPTLRNVAVTAPYMHNGVFQELRTVLAFYNKYLIKVEQNPETRRPWQPPEVADNISHDLLKQGQPLDDYRLRALTAFLRTLTDARFEHLLD